MRLLYFHQYFRFPDEDGGTRSYDLATSFAKEGHDVTIVTTTSDEQYKNKKRWNIVQRDGITIHYIYLPYSNHFSYFKRMIVFVKFLLFSSFHSFKIKADLVLATSTPLTIGIPALLKKWYQRTPYIFEVRDVWPEAVIAIGAINNKFLQKILFRLEKIIYKNAKAIVPLSTDMQHSIVSRFPKFTDKTEVVIENISEINRFQDDTIKSVSLKDKIGFEPRFSILYAGTFGAVNNIEYVIRLASKTIHYDEKLIYILMGEGANKQGVIDLAKEQNLLNKNIFILDGIAKKDLPSWYQAVSMGSSFVADIPTLWANSANKFFDTLAAGKPILINYEGWQSKIIKNHNVGFVLKQVLTEEDVITFVEYTKNMEINQLQGENALRYGKNNYSLKMATTKYLSIFQKIIGKAR